MSLTREQLLEAITDLLDGQSEWHEIQDATGLSEERCREIAEIGLRAWRELCKAHTE